MDHASLIQAATQTLIDHVDELNGLNMKRGALAIQARLRDGKDAGSLNETLKGAGATCMSTIGGSSGPVFGTLLMTLARELPAAPGPHDLAAALATSIAALTRL